MYSYNYLRPMNEDSTPKCTRRNVFLGPELEETSLQWVRCNASANCGAEAISSVQEFNLSQLRSEGVKKKTLETSLLHIIYTNLEKLLGTFLKPHRPTHTSSSTHPLVLKSFRHVHIVLKE